MIILMKGLDEEFYVKRCISDFHNEEFVSKIIVVDGKSTDFTVQELKQFPKVSVFVHEWIRSYHAMETSQSMICLSYVRNGDLFFILDFDERISPELKETLNKIVSPSVSFAYLVIFVTQTIFPKSSSCVPFLV